MLPVQVPNFDPEEDEPLTESSWPHLAVRSLVSVSPALCSVIGAVTTVRKLCARYLYAYQVVYEYMLRFIVSNEVRAKVMFFGGAMVQWCNAILGWNDPNEDHAHGIKPTQT